MAWSPPVAVASSRVMATVVGVHSCLVAVDASNIAHRVFHAGAATTEAALSAFVAFVGRVVSAADATHLLVALDAPGGCPTRRAVAPGYKAGRSATPEPLLAALSRLPDLCGDLGLAAHAVDGWEADDVLATATCFDGGVRLVSSDKDLHQLLDDQVAIARPDGTVLDVAALTARYGVGPTRWVEFAALVGEGADNLPGVPGIGPKRAAALLAAVTDVEAALADPSLAVPALGRAGADRLAAHADRVRSNRTVGTLRRDLGPLETTSLADLDPRALSVSASRLGVGGSVGQLAALALRARTRGG